MRIAWPKSAKKDWKTVLFDRNLVEKVPVDHNLPARLARFMPEDRISQVSDTMDELFGLMILNTDLISSQDAARLIALALAPKALALAA
jgi:hypothetical protein